MRRLYQGCASVPVILANIHCYYVIYKYGIFNLLLHLADVLRI